MTFIPNYSGQQQQQRSGHASRPHSTLSRGAIGYANATYHPSRTSDAMPTYAMRRCVEDEHHVPIPYPRR